MKSINVYYGPQLTGTLSSQSGRIEFQYAPDWKRFPISLSMPIRLEPYDDDLARAFFENLLPEGHILDTICRARKIDQRDLISFFGIYGRECAGAFTIAETYEYPLPGDAPREITLLVTSHLTSTFKSSLFITAKARMSLAGAQDKLPVIIEGNKIFLPAGDAPTTHLIKPDVPGFVATARNEHFCSDLARHLGCDVIDTGLLRFEDKDVFFSGRFDRVKDKNGIIRRLHQEDFCQAMGLYGSLKYHNSGGYDGIEELVTLCRKHEIAAGDKFARAMIVNFLLGNSDAHAKNFSILYDLNGASTLAPLYDIVCTDIYDGLDASFAMAFGDTFDRKNVTLASIAAMGEQTGIGADSAMALSSELACKCQNILPELACQHQQQYGSHEIYGSISKLVSNNCKLILNLCAGEIQREEEEESDTPAP